MLDQQLREEWRARERVASIHPTMTFTSKGLVLGAGTVLLQAAGPIRLQNLHGQEARVLALLAAIYGRAVAPSVLGNIERAVKSWRDGDGCLAHIHLAHSGLRPPNDVRTAACRLFIAERAMAAGMSPRSVLQILKVSRAYADAVEKAYNPDQPRIPAGSGRQSGEWTSDAGANGDDATETTTPSGGAKDPSLRARMPAPAPSFLGTLDAARVAELGAYAARMLGPIGAAAAVFGLLFIPSPNNLRVEGEVPDIPGLRYSWNRDETTLHLTYGTGDAQRTFALQVDGDFVRDDDEKVVGRVIGGNRIVIDTLAVLPDLLKQNEPRLCPAYAPDVAGSDQGKPDEENRARQYENFVKLMINPPPTGPTPSGFAYYLTNPEGGKPVSYDDCKWTNGILFEIKGETYAKLIGYLSDEISDHFLDQAARQIAAAGGRPVVWVFAEEEAAQFTRKLFDSRGIRGITIVFVPWIRSGP